MTLAYLYGKFFKKVLRGKCVRNSKVHPSAKIGSGSEFINSSIGRYSYIGFDANVVNCTIGQFCSIANGFTAGSAEHPTDWASTSPVFENVRHSGPTKRFARIDLPESKRTCIGNDVWIGAHVIIKQGVRVGNGAVIGSGAVLTKDVPAYAIAGGVPAKIIRYRFDEATIKALEASKWWDLSDEELKKVSAMIKNPTAFAEAVLSLKQSSTSNGGGYNLNNQLVTNEAWRVAA